MLQHHDPDFIHSFYKLLDILELLAQMPEFEISTDIGRENLIRFHVTLNDNEYDREECIISMRFSSSILTQHNMNFLNKHLNSFSLNKIKKNKFHDLRISFKIIKDESDDSTRKASNRYKAIVFTFGFEFYKEESSNKEKIEIIFPISPSFHQEVIKVIQNTQSLIQNPEILKHKQFIFLKELFQALRSKNAQKNLYTEHIIIQKNSLINNYDLGKEIIAKEQYQVLFENLTEFLTNLFQHNFLHTISKIENLIKQDKLYQQCNDIQKYNICITTQSFRRFIEFLERSLQERKYQIKSLSCRYDMLKFEIEIPPLPKDTELNYCLRECFSADFKRKNSKIKYLQQNPSFLCLRFGGWPKDPNKITLSIYLKYFIPEKPKELFHTHYVHFNLHLTSDFKEIIKKALRKKQKGDLNFVLECLSNLKKGNFFGISEDSCQSNIVDLNILNTYEKVICFQKFCQNLLFFLHKLAQNVNLELTPAIFIEPFIKQSQNKDNFFDFETFVKNIEDERFEVELLK